MGGRWRSARSAARCAITFSIASSGRSRRRQRLERKAPRPDLPAPPDVRGARLSSKIRGVRVERLRRGDPDADTIPIFLEDFDAFLRTHVRATRRDRGGRRSRWRSRRCAAAQPDLDHDRRYRRRLLPDGRRHGQHPVEIRPRPAGDGRGDRRLGRQPEAHQRRQVRSRLHHGRRRLGCVPGRRQVQGRQGQRPDADGALSQQDARRDHRGHGHQQAVRSQGQARVDGLARQRHGDHGVSRAGGRRHRRQEGHQAGAPGRRRIGQRDQGPQDRRVLLGRRRADRGRHRPGGHARHQDQADRPRRSGRRDEQEVRAALREERHSRPAPTRGRTRPMPRSTSGTSWSRTTR